MIPAGTDEVWETLTSREGMKAYMMGADVVQTDWQVGGSDHHIHARQAQVASPMRTTAQVRSFPPRRRLSYTHTSGSAPDAVHLVTFELARPATAGPK